jgi:hypothetical protein
MTDLESTGRDTVEPVDTIRYADFTTADLVRLAADQITRLVRNELQLARAEMAVKARRFGTGAGLFGTAGLVALYGVAALVAAAVLLLALVLPAWLAALIVAIALFAVAGIMTLLGREQFRRGGPPAPEQALNSVKADVQTVTEAVRKRGHR